MLTNASNRSTYPFHTFAQRFRARVSKCQHLKRSLISWQTQFIFIQKILQINSTKILENTVHLLARVGPALLHQHTKERGCQPRTYLISGGGGGVYDKWGLT